MNLSVRKLILFLIMIQSLLFFVLSEAEASAIYFKDGKVIENVSEIKLIGKSFVYKSNGKESSVFVYRIAKILDDNGNLFYEPTVYTYSKKWSTDHGYEYTFKKNEDIIATGYWDENDSFVINSGSLQDGNYSEYYDSGSLQSVLSISNNNLNGASKFYFDSGKLKREGTFVDGKEEGISKLFDANGDITGTSEYKDGRKNGETKLFYKSGNVKAVLAFSDGKVDGVQKTFYESGKPQTIVNFSNGLRNGSIEEYYETGKPMMKGSFVNDALNGQVTQYYESGRVKSSKLFDNGKLVK